MIGIYIRVSSATQVKDGYSLAAQKERLTAYCTAQGWTDYKFYIEKGLSAKNTKRPVYQELIQNVKDKKINTVLVYKLDRIMRSIGELDNMLNTLDKHDCAFKSATEPFDTTNATGKLFIYLVGALAQWEIELSSERIKMVLEEKVANEGVWIGNVPYPYDKNEKTKKLVANKERAAVTLKMIDMLKKGNSSIAIADWLNEHNTDKEWHPKAVLRILRNPHLCGHTTWNDDIYKNTHEGIISEEEYNQIQDILDSRSIARTRKTKGISVFQGKVECPICENAMTVNRFYRTRKDGSEYQSCIYKCNVCSRNKKFPRSPSETKLLNALSNYMRDETFDRIEKMNVKKVDNVHEEKIKELTSIENKRSKFQRGWANDMLTDEEFKKRMNETRGRYEQLKEELKDYKPPKQIDPEAIKDIIFTFNQNFKELTMSEKRDFVQMFIKRIKIDIINQPPLRPDKSKEGRYKVEITSIEFY